ncbi:MAG: hypothetical protein BWK78_01320 [Thiotrichaceae bacterium IS1]|nr:MAG: hypothetical protein BWK78_01320 [Thiotrichaceae bacterium IS1]
MKKSTQKRKKQPISKGVSLLRYSVVAVILGLLVGCSFCLSELSCATGVSNSDSAFNSPIKTFSLEGCKQEGKEKPYNPLSINKTGAFFLKESSSSKVTIIPYIINKLGRKQFIEFKDEEFHATCLEYESKNKIEEYFKENLNSNKFRVVSEDFNTTKVTENNKYKLDGYTVHETNENYDVPMQDVFKSLLEGIGLSTDHIKGKTNKEKTATEDNSNKTAESYTLPKYIKNFINKNENFINFLSFSDENCQLNSDKNGVTCKNSIDNLSMQIKGFDPFPFSHETLDNKSFYLYAELPEEHYVIENGKMENILKLSYLVKSSYLVKKLGEKVCIENKENQCSFCITPTVENIVKSQPGEGRILGKLIKKENSCKTSITTVASGSDSGKTNQQQGTHKLIVVSLSQKLGNEFGSNIQKAVTKLSKQEEIDKSSFDIFTFQSGGKIKKLDIANEKAITDTFQFSADDLNAMGNLDLLDSKVRDSEKTIGKILYITDDSLLSNNLRNIPSRQMGIVKIWYDLYKIELHVLTNRNCEIWENGPGASCEKLDSESNIHNMLQNFIQKGENQ